jgi:hypothetical protein
MEPEASFPSSPEPDTGPLSWARQIHSTASLWIFAIHFNIIQDSGAQN